MASKMAALQRYMAGGAKEEKKKKRKAKSSHVGMRVIDDDDDWRELAPKGKKTDLWQNETGEVDEDLPMVVDTDYDPENQPVVTNADEFFERERAEELEQQWQEDEANDRRAKAAEPDASPPRKSRRSDTPPRRAVEDASPPRRATSRDVSPPRRRARNEDSDASPPRRSRKDQSDDASPPRRRPADRGDASPPRRSRFSQVASPPPRSRQDASPPRQQREDASPPPRSRQDASPPRRQRESPSSQRDASPPRASKRESAPSSPPPQDASPPRRRSDHRRRDASPSPRRRRSRSKRRSRSASPRRRRSRDRSPRRSRRSRDRSPSTRRHRRDSPSPRRDHRGSGRSRSPRPRRSRSPRRSHARSPPLVAPRTEINDDADVAPTPPRRSSPVKAPGGGVFTGKEFRQESERARKQQGALFEDEALMGKQAETVYRDKRGRKLDMLMEMERQREIQEGKRKREALEEYEWGTGKVRKEELKNQREQLEEIKAKPFARYKDDGELDAALKHRPRNFDPMESSLFKDDAKELLEKASKKSKKSKPRYSGPSAPPNRFNIPPGYRWDGVVRGNNWEEKVLLRQNKSQADKADAYQNATADM